jgi:hypothetical protein
MAGDAHLPAAAGHQYLLIEVVPLINGALMGTVKPGEGGGIMDW